MQLEELLRQVDACQDELVALLQDLVRIPSVNTGVMPTGNETPVCEAAARKLKADGIASQILESAPGRGNLVARLPGATGKPRLLYMAHTDVVPVENEAAWTYPPFGGEVHDGRVHGRGASDMKGALAAEIMVMLILKRSGIALKGDLVLAACADEESGGAYGAGWLAKMHPDLVRADVGVNEGGGQAVKTPKGLAYEYNVGEKGRYELHITIRGRSFHASRPWSADNPLLKLPAVLQRIRDYQPEVNTSAPLFSYLQNLLDLPEPVTSANIDALADRLEASMPGMGSHLKACSRMTLVPTMVKAGVKSNSIAESVAVTCDIRSLPHQDTTYIQNELTRTLAGLPDVSWQLVQTAAPSASDPAHPFAGALRRATAAAIGRQDFAWGPGLTVGFTDSRLLRPLGTVIYDFLPSHPDADPSLSGVHNRNESEHIASLMVTTRMLAALAWEMLR